MINHARTLLLNVKGSDTGLGGYPGDEFIPPDFEPIVLPGYLQRIREQLFGSVPDRVMLNYRARQYMGLLASTELQEFVTDLDPRITYDILPEDQLFESLFTPQIQKLGSTVSDLFLVGKPGPPGQAGRTTHSWRIDVTSGTNVKVTRQTPVQQISIQEYTITEGLSSLIDLVGSGLQARFESGVGSEWLVSVVTRPEQQLGSVLANLEVVGQDNFLALFGYGTPKAAQEPFKTFRNLINHHHELAYRLGAFLLAWIYQADAIFKAEA